MSDFNRPKLPFYYEDGHTAKLIDSVNDNHLVAGRGITLERTTFGTTIHAGQQGAQNDLCYRGTYNFSASYQPNDVVFVDPNVAVLDQNGNPLCWGSVSGSATIPLCAGLFVCCNPVPPIGADDANLIGSVAPLYSAAGQTVTQPMADQYRHYSLNVYYPIYPLLGLYSGSALVSSSSQCVRYVAEESWETVANQTYWLPLAPCFTSSVCNQNGQVKTTFLNGIVSGSVFQYQLPYAI